MALFGSDIEKNIKKAAAGGEPQWVGVGKQVELRVWRIEQFKVVAWPIAQYGQFYDGTFIAIIISKQVHTAIIY
jgi:gelsolin